jgi:hypothetical protein
MEWNDPKDIDQVTKTFDAWAKAVLAKDETAVESFHDEGFRVHVGARLLTRAEHVRLEITVDNVEMRLTKVEATRRIGDILFVWSRHFIRASAVPPIPELGLEGDWANEAMAQKGFEQSEISVWRDIGGLLKCLAFEICAIQSRN